MKRPALSALAGGAAGVPATAVLTEHGAAATTVIAAAGLAALIGALVPELFWLLALILATRQRRWEMRHLGDVRLDLLDHLVARDGVGDVARARSGGSGEAPEARAAANRGVAARGGRRRRR